ncbi:MAG: glycosyltransferase family 2 protein, partial [Kiritimatiellae bacterium]|nr:glycosyltransferase family 2 protein [Kiritimatiellia bacterium]
RALAFVRANDGWRNTFRIAWRKLRRCGLGDALRAVGAHASPVPRRPDWRYRRYIVLHEGRPNPRALALELASLPRHRPTIVVVVPTDMETLRPMPAATPLRSAAPPDASRTPPAALRATLASLARQFLPADDVRIVQPARDRSPAAALSAACADCASDYLALVWPGDLLHHDTVLRMAQAILFERGKASGTAPDLLYTDEDRLSADGRRCAPQFKPQWSPDTLLAYPYIGDLALYRRAALLAASGFRDGLGSDTAYDLCLRVTERTDAIVRVAGVGYHRSSASTCATNIADPAAFAKALTSAIARRGLPARVVEPGGDASERGPEGSKRSTTNAQRSTLNATTPHLVYDVTGAPLVSIVVPTRNHGADVDACLASVFDLSTYRHFEILLVDNGSDDPVSLGVFERYRAERGVRVMRRDEPFNFSRLINAAAAEARGQFLLFLNNDTIVISPDWIERLLGFAQRSHAGAVAARLLYPDGTIQHAGVAKVGDGPTHVFARLPADYPHPRCQLDGNWSAVTAACMMVDRAKFERVGGFDETLAVAFNDVDFCFRLRDRGFFNVLAASAVLIHHEFKSRGNDRSQDDRRARMFAELERLYAKWPQYRDDPCYNPNLSRRLPDFTPRVIP